MARSSQVSAGWTPGSLGLGFDTSSSLSRILGAATSSERGGLVSLSTTTYELWVSNQRRERRRMDVSPSLTEPEGFTQTPFFLAVDLRNGTEEEGPTMTLQGGASGERGYDPNSIPHVLISSAAVSPAKTSPSPATEPGSQATAADCSSSLPVSLSLFDPAGYSSRTYPVSSLATAVGTSGQSLERWPTSGMAWPGGFSTAVSSECRSDAAGCSSSEPSLTEILEPPQNVPVRYSLSARAATGILRRAERRGRTLPPHLQSALSLVAASQADGESEPTRLLEAN